MSTTSPSLATRLVLLGTGTPNAEADRSGPASAIVSGGRAYLVDFGPGVVRRARAAQRLGIDELAPPRIDHAFVTHLHSDHTAGYPDLILTPWVLGRREPLQVYGPPGIRAMTDHLLAAFAEDIRVRTEGDEHANRGGCRVDAHEIEPGVVLDDGCVKVTAFAVEHGSWPHAFGYRFDAPDRSIVVSGDTTPCENLVRHAQGCDLLVHEVYSAAAHAEQPASWRRYHERSHTSTQELGRLADRVRPGRLILYHQLGWGRSPRELADEVAAHFDGEIVFGRDLGVF